MPLWYTESIYAPQPLLHTTVGRSFSVLKRLKPWLRTRMSDDRLRSSELMCLKESWQEASIMSELVTQFAMILDTRLPSI